MLDQPKGSFLTCEFGTRKDQQSLGEALEKCMQLGCGRPLKADGTANSWTDEQLAEALAQNKDRLGLPRAASSASRVSDWRIGNAPSADSFKNLLDILRRAPKGAIAADAAEQAGKTRQEQQEAVKAFEKFQYPNAASEEGNKFPLQ